MSANKFPEGWAETQVKRVLTQYQGQTEEEGVAEDEACGCACANGNEGAA